MSDFIDGALAEREVQAAGLLLRGGSNERNERGAGDHAYQLPGESASSSETLANVQSGPNGLGEARDRANRAEEHLTRKTLTSTSSSTLACSASMLYTFSQKHSRCVKAAHDEKHAREGSG